MQAADGMQRATSRISAARSIFNSLARAVPLDRSPAGSSAVQPPARASRVLRALLDGDRICHRIKNHLRLGSAVLRSPINAAQRRMHLRPYSLSQLDPSASCPASDDHAGRLREKRIVVVVSAVASDHCRNIAARLISEFFFRGSNAIRSALLVASVLNRFLGFIKCSMMYYFIYISVRVFSSVSVAS